ncbi:MAG: hypothetical protein M1818_006682 [Claussenomyces sp. TS43310]|nr:MAG: hypothetical protein M1818_006886 [Claussenomyces sp. TS43310]KAI9735104.1 MAG: hypothetical protein M1818_006682 [Claussenomyces sp. TS43310]
MSPHSDAPSPIYNFDQMTTEMAFTSPIGSGLRTSNSSIDADSSSQDSDSFSNTSVDTEDHIVRPLVSGVYVPTVCFFHAKSEDLDLVTIAAHAVRLAQAGVAGIATQGSNGEAVHLSHSERQLVTSTTRKALNGAGFENFPIIVGCGAQSTREAIQYCREAAIAGGDYALVLPPNYYAPLFAPNSRSIVEFFIAVADASPIPLVIYNYPGAVSGLDLNSDIIIELSQHPNIVGVKLTCGNTGKLNRIVAATKSSCKVRLVDQPEFLVLGGSADFTLQSLVGGGHGILAGLANLAPKACIETIRLYRSGDLEGARKLQEIVARGDWAAIQGGIVGTKAGMEAHLGYGGYARSPLPRPTTDETTRWAGMFKELMMLEKRI